MKRLLAAILVWILILSSTAFAGSSEFSPYDYPLRVAGKHIVVYYTTKGPDATTEAYARDVLAAAEEAYTNLVVKGGLRPPRVEPVAVALMADSPTLGGLVHPGDLGFDLWMKINPRMSKSFAVRNTVAHEFFHVLQAGYRKEPNAPPWGIEGTATVAPVYALNNFKPDEAELGQMSEYFFWAGYPMKEEDYMVSLFWYWLADRYGGVTYLKRLLTTAENVGWERGAQVAAIQGGAPDNTTFDTLWRSFVLAMVNGELPKGYQSEGWFSPKSVAWSGQSASGLDTPVHYFDPLARLYSYQAPRVVSPYSFNLTSILFSSSPLTLTVVGDPDTIEAYVVDPGPNVAAALADWSKRPSFLKPAAPPTDLTTRGARIPVGTPVQLQGANNSRKLLLVLRTGTWGDGAYSLKIGPDTGAAAPQWNTLAKVAGSGNSAGSPPPLTPAELAAVKAGTYLKGAQTVVPGKVAQGNILVGNDGSVEALLNNQAVILGAPVSDEDGEGYLVPARSFMKLFGGSVQGNRLVLGSTWVEATPGTGDYRTASGSRYTGMLQARIEGDELLVDMYALEMLGCETDPGYEDYTVVCPVPDLK
ncbi:MAG: hypothetical protein ACM3XM_09190 [Mycobacterium leprae]